MVRTQIGLEREDLVFDAIRNAYGLLSLAERNLAFLRRCLLPARRG